MSKLVNAPIASVDTNPFRRLGDYPYVEKKIDALMRSIEDVGLWEGVIARKSGNRYQIAFGHHRVEAARRSGLDKMPIIVRDLDDEQMLQFMGRENMEDYNADFLTMLETWEAAAEYGRRGGENSEHIDIATLLGWTRLHSDGGTRVNETAQACNAAHKLISAGHVKRDDLGELSVKSARTICQRAQANIDTLEKMAKKTGRPAKEVNAAKKHMGKAVKETARQVREGNIPTRNLGGEVDVNAYRFAKGAKHQSPLFEDFGKRVAAQIAAMLESDATAEKLREIQNALGDIVLESDRAVVRKIRFELGEMETRAAKWGIALDFDKVVTLKEVE